MAGGTFDGLKRKKKHISKYKRNKATFIWPLDRNVVQAKLKIKRVIGILKFMHLPVWFAGILWVIQYGKLFVGLNKRLSKVHKKKHMPRALWTKSMEMFKHLVREIAK